MKFKLQKQLSFVFFHLRKIPRVVFACVLLPVALPLHAQELPALLQDSLRIQHAHSVADTHTISASAFKSRKKIATLGHVAVYGTAMTGLYAAWYKDHPQSDFHFYNDFKEWKGMDKIGHAYSAYSLSKASMEVWKWTGMKPRKAIWLGGLSGAVFQTVIETLDGFSAGWGWSWTDILANTAGSGLLISQELLWKSQRIQLKTSFHRKKYKDEMLNARSDALFGKSLPERLLKDYNGQTYWLSANLHSFFPNTQIPEWLQVAVGTGAEGMFGGYENISRDAEGHIEFDRTDIPRRRQWYLAPDVDLTKIRTQHKSIKIILYLLNMFKFPTPALELSGGKLRLDWISF